MTSAAAIEKAALIDLIPVRRLDAMIYDISAQPRLR